jgi:hypothetical protein
VRDPLVAFISHLLLKTPSASNNTKDVVPVAVNIFGGEEGKAATRATGTDFTQADQIQIDPSQETNSGETHA